MAKVQHNSIMPLLKVNSNLLGYISKPNQACCPNWFGVNSLLSIGLFIRVFLSETSMKETSFHNSRIIQWAFCKDKPPNRLYSRGMLTVLMCF